MKARNRIAILFRLAIAIPTALLAQQQKSPVTIRVTDVTGAVILGAQVHLDPAPDPAATSMQTDQKGELSLDLKPGKYALEVNAHLFEKYKGELDVPGFAGGAVTAASKLNLRTIVLHVPCYIDGAVVGAVKANFAEILHLSLTPYHDNVTISTCEFPAFHHTTITYHNAHTNADETYSGVPLSDLLANYGVPLGKDLRGKALSLYIVAAGSDNYKVVLSLAEIDPAFHPGDALVADSMNGKSLLSAGSGPFKLVVTEDKRPARCVYDLVTIDLRSAE